MNIVLLILMLSLPSYKDRMKAVNALIADDIALDDIVMYIDYIDVKKYPEEHLLLIKVIRHKWVLESADHYRDQYTLDVDERLMWQGLKYKLNEKRRRWYELPKDF